jgi:Cu-Zn family superoxide dismutase
MKKILLGSTLLLASCDSYYNTAHSDVYLTTNTGLGQKIGEVSFMDTPSGLLIDVDLQHLPQGEHGFHIHEKPDCGVMADAQGTPKPALKAGGHYDPDKTGHHMGPNKPNGHKGDLPVLTVSPDGTVKTSFTVKNLKVKEIKNRSIMVHAGGDNYSDEPLPLGGGGARIACGIIK